MNTNIYKYFRGVETVANPFILNKRFDEPTYLSFRLIFGDESDKWYNDAGFIVSNDTMPHPLFNNNDYKGITTEDLEHYSAVRYLIDANEPTRADMLKEFIYKFDYLQQEYPYYFQAIDGVGELLKVDPTKGQRILNDKKLSITCLEGLDQRMTYLMNLYKKTVWDDVYQRWVLPDMMRYFTLKIYLSEFRTFHIADDRTGYGQPNWASAVPISLNYLTPKTPQLKKNINSKTTEIKATQYAKHETPIYLKILDNILPVWIITCEMCEFDITDINFEHLTGLNVATEPIQGAIKFGIKVGNIKELQMYPVFQHMFLNDRKLNGLARLKDKISTTTDQNTIDFSNYPTELQIAQSNIKEIGHISILPYLTRTNENNIGESSLESKQTLLDKTNKGSQATAAENPMYDPKMGGEKARPVDSTLPNTWIGNALDFGASYVRNFMNKLVDKGKTMTIPGLGASFTEIQSAIQSKDIVTAFGLIRKAVNFVKNDYVFPSERLSGKIAKETEELEKAKASEDLGNQITDTIMLQLINSLVKSEATDETTIQLKEAANIVLNDKGIWEKIKDYSKATDLISIGEVNVKNEILNKSDYKNINKEESISRLSGKLETGMKQDVELSAATNSKLQANNTLIGTTIISRTLQIGEVIESVPSSKATNSKLETSNLKNEPISTATNNKLEQ